MTHTGIEPIPVLVANAADLLGAAAEAKRRHIRSTFRTFVLTAANPVVPVLAEDRSRTDTWMIAYGNSVVLCDSQSQAEDPDNQIAGTGVFSNTPANPQGTLLYVPPAVAGAQGASINANGTVTNPSAGEIITGASAALPAGTYAVSWNVGLGGTTAAADVNNFQLVLGATPVLPSLNASTSGGVFSQLPTTITVPAGGAILSVQAIAQGTSTAVYRAQFTALPAASPGSSPVQQSARWTIDTTEVCYAVALAYPAYLAITTHNPVKSY